MDRLQNWLKELSNSSKLVGVVVLLSLGYLTYKHVDTKKDKLPYIGIVAVLGLLYVYVTDCLTKGDCVLLSWVFAIMMSIVLLFISGLLSEIPFKVVLKIQEDAKLCREQAILKNPDAMEGVMSIGEKINKVRNFFN